MNKSLYGKRKCVVCGLEKPMSAFLIKGNNYSTICATCAAKGSTDEEGGGRGLRVDDKAKVQAEHEQKEREKKQKELARDDREFRDLTEEKKNEKKDLLSFLERKHRETYIESQKEISPEAKKKAALSEAAEIDFEKKKTQEATTVSEQQTLELETQRGITEKDTRTKTATDFSAPFFAPQFSEIRFTNNEALRTFQRQWAGSAPLARMFGQNPAEGKGTPNAELPAEKPAAEATKSTSTLQRNFDSLYHRQQANQKSSAEPSLIESMEQTFGPSKKR